MDKIYYLDNAATTKVFDEVFDLMKQNNETSFYNPSASYKLALDSKKNLNSAREKISSLLRGEKGKLYFTSSATESNNTVFEGVHLRPGDEVLISAGEHPSVYEAAQRLLKKGVIVKEIPITKNGKVDTEKYEKLLSNKVVLISVIHVSNETGAVNDIKNLVKIAKSFNSRILFHSDGVQAFGKVKVNLVDLGVDLYTISAHKIYAPRGIAALWVKKGTTIDSFLVGGGQEDGFRSSTENVAGAIAFAYAAQKVVAELENNKQILDSYKKTFLDKILNSEIGKFVTVNSPDDAVSNIVSISFDKIKGEVLMYALDGEGVLVSKGSACSSKKAGNRVLDAMGVSQTDIIGSIRVSFSPYEKYDFDYISKVIISNVCRFENNVIVKK